MPRAASINPKTGRRFGWEAEQAAKKAAENELRDIEQRLSLLKRQQMAVKARERFMPFVKFTSPDPEAPSDVERSRYKNARHHDAIARALEEVVKGNIRFLILTMPPRHGKSELVSRRLPAWFMGRFPDMNGVVATYNDDFAMDFGKDVRSIVRAPAFKQVFPGVELLRGGGASDRLQTNKGGQWSFVGRGGSLTGRGAHILILDDIIKDDKEAQSAAIREQAWSWFTKVAMSRRMGMKLVILTFTRWHSDDPIGRLTDPENPNYVRALAEKIKIINFPAIAEDDDPLGREPGEPLWPDGPDKFDLDFLAEQQALDPLGFAALYQQRPSLMDGDLFKRENIRFYGPGTPNEKPEDLRIYAASDHAVSTAQRRDPSCFLKIGVSRNNDIYILDCVWQKMAADVAVEAMLSLASGKEKPLVWWAERGHISKSIGPFLRKRMLETGNYINIREVTPVADKATRAQSIVGRVAMGKVYFPFNARWTERALNEMMAFPNGPHDDFVDALGLIGLGLQSQFAPGKSGADRRAKETPEFGTLAWVKLQSRWQEDQKAERLAGGF
jgi:predicted phage terminase large subunit-like protein